MQDTKLHTPATTFPYVVFRVAWFNVEEALSHHKPYLQAGHKQVTLAQYSFEERIAASIHRL